MNNVYIPSDIIYTLIESIFIHKRKLVIHEPTHDI